MNIEKMREAVATAIWNIRREEEDRCDIDLDDLDSSHSVWAEADAAIAAVRETIEPDFYWPDGDEGGSSSVEEMAQDAYGWDGSLWEDQDIACAHELPTRTYRSFLDDKGEVQVERIK